MKWPTATVIVVVVALIGGGFVVSEVFTPDTRKCVSDARICDCAVVLSEKRVGGVKVSLGKGGNAEVDVGAVKESATDLAAGQVDAWKYCLNEKDLKVRVVGGINIPQEPIGQVVNRWKRESGIRVDLVDESSKILQNLQIGPAAGSKIKVLKEWCQGKAASCVTCQPRDWHESGVQMLIGLKSDAPVEQVQLPGKWSPLADKPWQLVDDQGKRYLYQCVG